MTKKPRRTMADVASGLRAAATAAAPIAEPPGEEASEAGPIPRENVSTRSRAGSVPPAPVEAPPPGFNQRKQPRAEKPHQSIYAHPVVFRELRKIAAVEGVKPQELYREGLREVFRRRGLDFDRLDEGEEV